MIVSDVTSVVDGLTAEQARAVTDRIRVGVDGIREALVEAWRGRAYLALGYDSWDDWTVGEFGGVRIALPVQERRELVGDLRQEGMSLRGIAGGIGAAVGTVHSDATAGVQNRTPAPAAASAPVSVVTGRDGKSYSAKAAPRPAPARAPTPLPVVEEPAQPTPSVTSETTELPPPPPLLALPTRTLAEQVADAISRYPVLGPADLNDTDLCEQTVLTALNLDALPRGAEWDSSHEMARNWRQWWDRPPEPESKTVISAGEIDSIAHFGAADIREMGGARTVRDAVRVLGHSETADWHGHFADMRDLMQELADAALPSANLRSVQ